MTDLEELDARITKFKKQLIEDGVMAKDWAKWDAEHPYTPVQTNEPYNHQNSQAHHDALYAGGKDMSASERGSGKSSDEKIELHTNAAQAYASSAQEALDHGDQANAATSASMAEKHYDSAAKLQDSKADRVR